MQRFIIPLSAENIIFIRQNKFTLTLDIILMTGLFYMRLETR